MHEIFKQKLENQEIEGLYKKFGVQFLCCKKALMANVSNIREYQNNFYVLNVSSIFKVQ